MDAQRFAVNGEKLSVQVCSEQDDLPAHLLLQCLDKLAHALSINSVAGGDPAQELELLARVVKAFKRRAFSPDQLRRLPAAARVALMRRIKTSMHSLERSVSANPSLPLIGQRAFQLKTLDLILSIFSP